MTSTPAALASLRRRTYDHLGSCACGHASSEHNEQGWCVAAGCGCGRLRPVAPVDACSHVSACVGRSPLGALNFVVLQWFGVRLQAAFEPGDLPRVTPGSNERVYRPGRWWSSNAPQGVEITWSLLRWVWPLTGWWSAYRWIVRR